MLLGVGILVDRPLLVAFLGTLGYLIWHLVNLYRLDRWLRRGRKASPPDAIGIWSDVLNEVYRLQQRNRKRKKRLRKILRSFQESTGAMPDGAVVLGPAGEIMWWNAAAMRLLGLHSPQDVGQRVDNLIRHPAFLAYLAGEMPEQGVEIPSPEKDTSVINLCIVRYGSDQRLLMVRDVTRLRRLERMRQDFVANVSHELRTPLTVLRGYLETLVDADRLPAERRRQLLETMQQQTLRMERLLVDLLLLSRLEADGEQPQLQPICIPDLLAEVRNDALAMSDGRHNIALIADSEVWLRGVRNELYSAFGNLVANAVNYTPEGGDIRIRWYADDGGAHFEVADTGEGIAPRHLPRLTERFYRVDSSRSRGTGGTGLGLAIVKHVLERHEGRLDVSSVPGKGSTFLCTFPSSLIVHPPRKTSSAI